MTVYVEKNHTLGGLANLMGSMEEVWCTEDWRKMS